MGRPENINSIQTYAGGAMSAIIKPKDLLAEILELKHQKLSRGYSTGWPDMDEYFTVRPGEFTVITGMPSHGKSEWLDALCVNLVKAHGFRIPIFSPENHPLEMHLSKILEKYTGKTFWGQGSMDEEEIFDALDKINQNFAFIKPSETEFTPKDIANLAADYLAQSLVTTPKAMIVDPWNEMDHYRPSGLSETEYISRILTELRRFAREYKTHLFLVAHPMKMQKDKDGNYPVPRPYDISGSAHWYNKADNCIAVWRDVVNEPHMTQVHIQKVRFKATGNPGMVNLEYMGIGYEQPMKFPRAVNYGGKK
jgi:twinkle protein